MGASEVFQESHYSMVAAKFNLKKCTVDDILRKAKARAADPDDFDDVLGCFESYHELDVHQYAIHDHDSEKQHIRVMFWGAIILAEKGLYHIWELDTAEEKENYQQIVSEENQLWYERQLFNQQQSHISATWQYEKLLTLNNNIDQININEGRIGQHKRK
ncbi:hypothetical protein L873DRAFT_1847810 [Choiromyces venosus 120613-1]|uniref:Uncharacterized protein n=1 Tax=Choiromyces venosus 120613-1 TaxID=1336337 RepID=A0A3N4J506_9PEZI|nr:hypothetical protein L873DRAFT_1847810 [Choiromyces venosus 120613-1]